MRSMNLHQNTLLKSEGGTVFPAIADKSSREHFTIGWLSFPSSWPAGPFDSNGKTSVGLNAKKAA